MSQWPYSFEVLEVGRLFVDESYQRPLTTFAGKIERNFDPALVGTLVVSERGKNRYAIVDGQTRAAAIVNLAAEDKAPIGVPCLVYHGLSQADEARLFARLQKERRGIASAHRFRAAVVAGEEEAIAITALAEAAGYEIGANAKTELTAVAALERVYRRGPELLERTLSVSRRAWPDVIPSGAIIRGLGKLLGQDSRVDDGRLVERLRTVTVDELRRRALALSEGMGGSGNAETYMAQAIEGVYRARLEVAA